MGSTVIHTDLEMFLVTWLRAKLAARFEPVCASVMVSNVEPGSTWPSKLVVVRDDGGDDTSAVTDERSIGVRVYAGSMSDPTDAIQLAHIVRSLLWQCPAVEPGNPVAAVTRLSSPIAVHDNQHAPACRYITGDLVVVGTEFI